MIGKAYKLTDDKVFALSGRVLPTMNTQGVALGYEPNAALSGRSLQAKRRKRRASYLRNLNIGY